LYGENQNHYIKRDMLCLVGKNPYGGASLVSKAVMMPLSLVVACMAWLLPIFWPKTME
jgi:hypothetical protein